MKNKNLIPKNKKRLKKWKDQLYYNKTLNRIAKQSLKNDYHYKNIEQENAAQILKELRELSKYINNIILKQIDYHKGLYPNIEFDSQMRPKAIKRPLNLNELKLIVKMGHNIKLRSPETEQAYQQSDKSPLEFIYQKIEQYPDQKTIIKLNNNYPYNLKSEYKH